MLKLNGKIKTPFCPQQQTTKKKRRIQQQVEEGLFSLFLLKYGFSYKPQQKSIYNMNSFYIYLNIEIVGPK